MSEHDEQAAVIEWSQIPLHLNRWPCLEWLHAIPNAAKRSPWLIKRMKAEGLVSGICDLFLPFPMLPFCGLYIEMKWGKNKESSDQKRFIQYARSVGYKVVVCYTAEEAIREIQIYLQGYAEP